MKGETPHIRQGELEAEGECVFPCGGGMGIDMNTAGDGGKKM